MRRWGATVAAVVVIAVANWLAMPSSGGVAQDTTNDRLGAVETRIAELEDRVATLEGSEEGAAATAATSDATEPATPGETSTGTREEPAAIGETVERRGYAVTVLEARIVPPGEYFMDPDKGQAFLALDVRIENVGTEPLGFGDSYFDVKDIVEGYEFDNTSATMFASDRLGNGQLLPGDFVRGTVAIFVNEGTSEVLIRFHPALYQDDDLAYWRADIG